ncbi:hypothetical protein R3I93_009700 [Phoxinus phoxinus]|uniref:Uncharacterized protein n=1 Tax=Phoxinus phoxinus TaxID=58324 RepID=A0AAN9D379_9TELE
MYAVGSWTVLGGIIYQCTLKKYLITDELPVEEEDNRPNVEKYETAPSETTIVRFVPLSTRFLNLFRSTNKSENHEEEK